MTFLHVLLPCIRHRPQYKCERSVDTLLFLYRLPKHKMSLNQLLWYLTALEGVISACKFLKLAPITLLWLLRTLISSAFCGSQLFNRLTSIRRLILLKGSSTFDSRDSRSPDLQSPWPYHLHTQPLRRNFLQNFIVKNDHSTSPTSSLPTCIFLSFKLLLIIIITPFTPILRLALNSMLQYILYRVDRWLLFVEAKLPLRQLSPFFHNPL